MKDMIIPDNDVPGHVFKVVVNAPALMMGVGTVLAGAAVAAADGYFEWIPTIMCMLFACFAQVTSNALHRYYDAKRNLVSGESKELEGLQIDSSTMTQMLQALTLGSLMLAGMIGITIVAMAGWWCLIPAAVIAFLVWISNSGPIPLMHTPVNLLVSFLVFGPVGVISTAMVILQHHAPGWTDWNVLEPGVYFGVCMGLMAVNSHLLYGYYTYRHDLLAGRKTMSTLVGLKHTRELLVIGALLSGIVMICLDSVVMSDDFLSLEWWLYAVWGVLYIILCSVVYSVMKQRKRPRKWDMRTGMCLAMMLSGAAFLVIITVCR